MRGRPRSRPGTDRGADRPRPQRPDAALARHRHPARGGHALRGRAAARLARAAARQARDRPHAPDPRPPRRRSACPSPATAVYGVVEPGLAAPVPARGRARLPAPVHRRAGRGASPLPDDLARFLRPGRSSRYDARSCSRPGGRTGGGAGRLGPVPSAPRRLKHASSTEKGAALSGRHHARAPGGRSPLRPPDPPLEPEDEALHLHGARRHLHHRPPADARAARGGARLRAEPGEPRRLDALRRHEEAEPGRGRRARGAREDALRQPPLARRPAHELAHDLEPDRAPARAAPAEGGGPARAAARQGADHDARRAREARGEPGRRRRHAQAAGRRLHRRPAQGAARRPRGAPAGPARGRARGHELRSRRGRLRHPRQRRRDPLVQPDRPRDRRRDRRRADRRHRRGVRPPERERKRDRVPSRRPRPTPSRRRAAADEAPEHEVLSQGEETVEPVEAEPVAAEADGARSGEQP